MSDRGILIVLSGFSGAGKGTIVRQLLETYDQYVVSVSATTRPPRQGEQEGVSYFFHTKQEFEEMIRQDAFIEYAQYVGNYYGTPKDYVEKNLAAGKDVILEIEIQGARRVKEMYPDTLMLFVSTPDAKTLKERLIRRGTESEDVIESRLRRAAKEADGITDYDYLVVNDDLETCVRTVHALVTSEHHRVSRSAAYIAELRRDMQQFLKGA